jgi:group I intron endonuclease
MQTNKSKLNVVLITKRYYSYNNKNNNHSNIISQYMDKLNIDPIFVYEDVHLTETKERLFKELKGLSGIYMVLNKFTGDYYIGSAATNRFSSRFSKHLISFLGSKVVKNAVKKYGIENFAFIVLELFPKNVDIHTNRELLDLEDNYLSLLTPTYNILTEAGSSFGYKHSDLDRQKMKDNYSEERRKRIGDLNKGKKFSLETIEKMRMAALNRSPISEDTRAKLSKSKSITIYNLNGTIFGSYDSIVSAASALNCGEKTIRRALKTESKLVKKQ